MEEKVIIKMDDLHKMVEQYTMYSSEEYKLEMVYSSLIPSNSKNSFIFDYTVKANENSYITNRVILFKNEIINIFNYINEGSDYKATNYEILENEECDIEISVVKKKVNKKTKVMVL